MGDQAGGAQIPQGQQVPLGDGNQAQAPVAQHLAPQAPQAPQQQPPPNQAPLTEATVRQLIAEAMANLVNQIPGMLQATMAQQIQALLPAHQPAAPQAAPIQQDAAPVIAHAQQPPAQQAAPPSPLEQNDADRENSLPNCSVVTLPQLITRATWQTIPTADLSIIGKKWLYADSKDVFKHIIEIRDFFYLCVNNTIERSKLRTALCSNGTAEMRATSTYEMDGYRLLFRTLASLESRHQLRFTPNFGLDSFKTKDESVPEFFERMLVWFPAAQRPHQHYRYDFFNFIRVRMGDSPIAKRLQEEFDRDRTHDPKAHFVEPLSHFYAVWNRIMQTHEETRAVIQSESHLNKKGKNHHPFSSSPTPSSSSSAPAASAPGTTSTTKKNGTPKTPCKHCVAKDIAPENAMHWQSDCPLSKPPKGLGK